MALTVTEAERLLALADDELAVTPGFLRVSRRKAARKMRFAAMPPIQGPLGGFVAARRKWERGLDWWVDELRAEHLDDMRRALARYIERERNPVTEPNADADQVQGPLPVTRERVRASWSPGGTCGLCERMLEPDEPVTMTVISVKRDEGLYASEIDLRAVVCEPCSTDDRVGALYGHHRRWPSEVSDGYKTVWILGDVWCWQDESADKWDRCHRDQSPHEHTLRLSDADSYILLAPCEGCGRPVRTATRYTRKVGTRTVRRKRWDPQPGESKYVKVDEPVYEYFTACSSRCVTDVRRPRARDRGPVTCNTCGEPFDAVRPDARYCSSACRQRAYRERKR